MNEVHLAQDNEQFQPVVSQKKIITLRLTSTQACYEESLESYPTHSWCTTLLRETRPDAQALFHLIANLARELTASLTACARSRIHFKRHDLRFHVLSLARRWWEAHSLILGHPPPHPPPPHSFHLSLSPNPLNLFRLVQPAWHSSKGAKTRLPAELGKPLPVRSAWSTPQASLLRLIWQALFGDIKINQRVMWHNLCESHLHTSHGPGEPYGVNLVVNSITQFEPLCKVHS